MSLSSKLQKKLRKESISKDDLKDLFNKLNSRHLNYSETFETLLAYHSLSEKFHKEKRYQDIKDLGITAADINEQLGEKMGLTSFAAY